METSQQPKPAKALRFVFASPGSSSSPAKSVMTVSSGEIVVEQSMSEAEGPEPAKAVQNQPANMAARNLQQRREQLAAKPSLQKLSLKTSLQRLAKGQSLQRLTRKESLARLRKKATMGSFPKLWLGA